MNRALAEAGKSTKSAVLKPSIITSKAVFWRFFYKLEPIRYSARKSKRYNARLRGWQRTAELKKHTVNTELQFCTKVATRWQSLLSRLLGQQIDNYTFKTKEQGLFENWKPTKRFIYKQKSQISKETKKLKLSDLEEKWRA